MLNPLALAAPFALLMPFFGQGHGVENQGQSEGSHPTETAQLSQGDLQAQWDGEGSGDVMHQFRIDQRVIIRIQPRQGGNRNNLLAQLPQNGLNTRFEEREMDRCIPVNRIAGVQSGAANRLLLFLNDNRILTLNLERSCRARDFYSGFYVERNEDGRLCVGRDALQSRSGARCDVEAMRQLVAVND